MPKDAQAARNAPIDPAWIAAIAREVIARLKATPRTGTMAASIDDRIITANTLEKITSATQIFIAPEAVVTPSARDEARRRGITINRTVEVLPDQQPNHAKLEITDTASPERADAVRKQLARRGDALGAAKIVLSDTPARDVHQQCTADGEVAVMISSVTDVRRFAVELSPTVWVLDMERLNIPAAVNAIAQITQLGTHSR